MRHQCSYNYRIDASSCVSIEKDSQLNCLVAYCQSEEKDEYMRRTVTCSTAALIVVCALLFSPTASFAEIGAIENPTVCPKTCPKPVPQKVEVTSVREETITETWIDAPLLPTQGRSYSHLEHEYFIHLYSIASRMCEALGFPNENTLVYTGFSTQLTEFNTTRRQLNRLLLRYRMGYAPNLEDFSKAEGLELELPPTHKANPNQNTRTGGAFVSEENGIDIGNTPGASFCTFKIV